MSRGTLYVRFPDGTVRYGIYNGTSDVAWPLLFDTPEDAWDAWYPSRLPEGPRRSELEARARNAYQYERGSGEPVECATDYGGEWAWTGATATRTHLTSGHEPDGEELGWGERGPSLSQTKGLPSWAVYPAVAATREDQS